MDKLMILDAIKSVLLSFDDKYISGGELQRYKIIEDLDKYDPKLITALLKNKLIREVYTEKVLDTEIFKVNQFIDMLEYKEYWQNSYTKFKNKIGLTANGKFIDESSDVVLDFPFKDTVLRAGMTKEDSTDNDEVFLHETIAKPEIDELLEPKIFKNVKKYDKDGIHEINKFTDDDNLIIKGNNLIALYSIKERYAGKIKQIILDPPYYFCKDKSVDSFTYNSDFKLSTWLTFMKNRLEIAKEFLAEDGIISIIIGEDGLGSLKVLCDSIFGTESFIGIITWRKTDNQANNGNLAKVTDYILIYGSKESKLNKLPLSDKAKKEYRYKDEKGYFRRAILLHKTRGKYKYELETPGGKILKGPWMKPKDYILEADKKGDIYWTKGGEEQPYGKIYLEDSKGQIPNNFWDNSFGTNQRGATEIKKLFDNKRLFDFPKPELLIKNLISIGSNENDIVLDFFMGSATTQAVAMKMNRRFIGIEQMDYINEVSVQRLQKVIYGEQGGISKEVNWQGGGSFVYAELMDKTYHYIEKIKETNSIEELNRIYLKLKNSDDLNFLVDLEEFEATKEELTLEEQKEILINIIDKNQLYYNYQNIDDSQIKNLLTEEEYEFNKSFYRNGDK